MQHVMEIDIRKRTQPPSNNPKYIYATQADNLVKSWRQWWSKFGMAQAPPHSFGPASPDTLPARLPRKELIDPWRVHTIQCAHCRRLLARTKAFRRVGWGLLWIAAALVRRRSHAILLGLLGLATSVLTTRVIRDLEGVPLSSQVGDRCPSAE